MKKISDHNQATGTSKEDAITPLSDDEGNLTGRKHFVTNHYSPDNDNLKPAAVPHQKKTSTNKPNTARKRGPQTDKDKAPFLVKRRKSSKVSITASAQKQLKVTSSKAKTPSKNSKATPTKNSKTSKPPITPTKKVAQKVPESEESDTGTSFPKCSRMHKINLPAGMKIKKNMHHL